MAFYAIYDKNTGIIKETLSIPESLKGSINIHKNQDVLEVEGFVDNTETIVKNGLLVELLPINNPIVPYSDEHIWNPELNQWELCPELDAYKHLELQEEAWENIKERRLQAVTSGVYVESADKWFHTDEVSVTSYSTIAGMIALDNYEPVQWKTMDNTWLLLTVDLFKELQTAMSVKTNINYAIAEQHKAAMLKATNPLEYDYSEGWI